MEIFALDLGNKQTKLKEQQGRIRFAITNFEW